MRVDVANSVMVTPGQLSERPEILKILFRGSTLDLDLFERMTSRELIPLGQYWKNRFGIYNGRAKQAGNGYQKLGRSSRIRKNGDGKPGVPADYLSDLNELSPQAFEGLLVNHAQLLKFNQERIHDPRPRSLFMSPLFIVRESPSAKSSRIRVSISEENLVYNKSYQGYSAQGDPKGKQLVRYLALLVGSKPAIWFSLMNSGRFGVEREVIENITIDSLPIVPFESLRNDELEKIDHLFDALAMKDSPENWIAVDTWAATLYGLREQELRVIDDTLRFNLPFAKNKKAAQNPTTKAEADTFCKTLENELNPWAEREYSNISVHLMKHPADSPWAVVQVISATTCNSECSLLTNDWPEVLRIANSLAATEVIYPEPKSRCLWIARLNQARYWSHSQARLVAQRIVWEHLDSLLGVEGK